MVSQTTIVVTALLQVLGISFFMHQPGGQCSPAPSLGNNIFLVAILLLLWDGEVIPQRFKQRSPWIFAGVELLATIFVAELIMQVVWCGYERIAFKTVRMICNQPGWCESVLLLVTTSVGAIASLCIVVEVVCPAPMKDSMGGILGRIPIPNGAGPLIDYIQDVRSYIMGAIFFSQLTREQRLSAVHAFEVQVERSKISKQQEQIDDPVEQEREIEMEKELERVQELHS
ncbi:hypothetical protein KR009_011694 [Drosophila setifemur]|nr:hypothetical protein KR009_011694 [Drosophila setifemur]